MSNKKQSSVNWLVNHWKKLQSEDAKMSWNQIIEITELVKAMHEEEAKKHFNDGYANGGNNWGDGSGKTAEQYYNETYGGNNE